MLIISIALGIVLGFLLLANLELAMGIFVLGVIGLIFLAFFGILIFLGIERNTPGDWIMIAILCGIVLFPLTPLGKNLLERKEKYMQRKKGEEVANNYWEVLLDEYLVSRERFDLKVASFMKGKSVEYKLAFSTLLKKKLIEGITNSTQLTEKKKKELIYEISPQKNWAD